ncbi:MAG: DUF559 domain-containing protein [Thermoplasmata archaeon]
MSPIELKLYEAMLREGLSPCPQVMIEGYIVDFAFPDVKVAVEADGVAYHAGDRRERDKKRDWVLRREGWTVKRFWGTTIHTRAANCAYVVKREVEERRRRASVLAREREMKREKMWASVSQPFKSFARLFLKR